MRVVDADQQLLGQIVDRLTAAARHRYGRVIYEAA